MKLKSRNIQFNIKEIKEDGTFSGYGSVFGVRDAYNESVEKGAFLESLEKHKARGTMPALLWQHDHREPIGVWEKMEEDDHGLYVEGRLLVDDDPLARRARAHLKAGSVSGLSIGFVPKNDEWDDEEKILRVTAVDLWETSIVTFPANSDARVQQVRAMDYIKNVREFEAVLRDELGFSARQAKRLASGGWPAVADRDGRDDEAKAIEAANKLINSFKS
nr:primosome assembly protein PriA [bacterium]